MDTSSSTCGRATLLRDELYEGLCRGLARRQGSMFIKQSALKNIIMYNLQSRTIALWVVDFVLYVCVSSIIRGGGSCAMEIEPTI